MKRFSQTVVIVTGAASGIGRATDGTSRSLNGFIFLTCGTQRDLLGPLFPPMRYMKAFAWENTWFVWPFCGCSLFPPLIAYLTIPSLLEAFRATGLRLNCIMLGVGFVAGG